MGESDPALQSVEGTDDAGRALAHEQAITQSGKPDVEGPVATGSLEGPEVKPDAADGALTQGARDQVEAAYRKMNFMDVATGRGPWAAASARLAERRERRAEMTPEQLQKSKFRRRAVVGAAGLGAAAVTAVAVKHGLDHHGVLASGHETTSELPPGMTIQAETAAKLVKIPNRPHTGEHTAGAMEAMASHNVLGRIAKWWERRRNGKQ